MKAKTTKVAIPRGWRKLRVGTLRKKGDVGIYRNDPTLRFATDARQGRIDRLNDKHFVYIRKSTARPRKGKARKVSKAGGRKGK